MGRTCGEPDEIKKNTHPKNITLFFARRYALQLGPVVLAAVGQLEPHVDTVVVPHPPVVGPGAGLPSWLTPVPGKTLHFAVQGAPGVVFKPMWDMLPADPFTTFPIFNGTAHTQA